MLLSLTFFQSKVLPIAWGRLAFNVGFWKELMLHCFRWNCKDDISLALEIQTF